ncbi:MAG: lytic transglycosylase domain-containing protein [Deltaproteobacteria bacterium]|nr:lytic transglycosylase domain-containing protein [Deltaproteobacteria bacterium]MBW1952734.1 lytic transglycosylase domain-containing protein [Deltaproteobacteria bacterium]MBW1986367.1 lytic transglycosylase domain-containing protein [Deltaproteobacteria bacterium]MBW2133760.1 lytic transglycosylase domain-containing protein [Deltaproteobacteria bacterium]
MFFIILLFLAVCLWPYGSVATHPKSSPWPSAQPTVRMPYYELPKRLTLCGEVVPVHDRAVWEAMDKEFIIVVWNRIQTTLWLKRATRYFPDIEKKLRQARLPDDLKYVALVESDLRPEARSPRDAWGPWQIIKATANRFDLKTEKHLDERLDFDAATEAALQYLKFLHRKFGNWALALAAYNCGEGRLQKEIAEQGVRDYYRLSLPEETERYVLRIIAAKIVLGQPAHYGYEIPADQLYPPLEYDQVKFILHRQVHLRQVAQACGTYFKAIKGLNPQIQGYVLVPGFYRLKVPRGSAPDFYESLIREHLTIP